MPMRSNLDQPEMQTERLLLRAFKPIDSSMVKVLANDKAIASTTLNIPYPYDESDARRWIRTHPGRLSEGKGIIYAIVLQETGEIIGAIGLAIDSTHNRAEMGYWLGSRYWNQGYCTEAAAAVLSLAFEHLGLNRVYASHFSRNPASGQVMEKIGMRYEGVMRQHVKKWNAYEDLKLYGILHTDYEDQQSKTGR